MSFVKLIHQSANPAVISQTPQLLNFSTSQLLNFSTSQLLNPSTLQLITVKPGWPVFFFQARPGRHARIFRLYKFRTMNNCRNEQGALLPDTERLTGLGRLIRSLSLDELPQLWNVLKGDMSLVGPRPLLPRYLPLYNKRQARLHEVRPGITGWAQVNGRNAVSWEQKFEMDVWYVENMSIALDCKILWITLIKVIRREGINSQGGSLTGPFLGNNKQAEKV